MSSNEAKRRAFLGHLTTAINKLNAEVKAQVLDEYKIRTLIEQVETKFRKVEEVTGAIQENMELEALEADIAKLDLLENQVIESKVKAKTVLEKMKQLNNEKQTPPPPPPLPPTPQVPYQPPHTAVKLPDVKLQDFDGKEENFPSFIDQFNALIHNNRNLTNIEKFGYLRGAAKVDVIQHFPLTEQNYIPALTRLKEEFGDEEFIAKKHQNALLDMGKRKKPSNDRELQQFYNFIESKLACLEALDRPVQQADEMLITLIHRQLPTKLRIKIAQLDNHNTIIKAVMEIIKEHITTNKRMAYRDESDSEQEHEAYNYKSRYKTNYSSRKNDDYGSDQDEIPMSSASALPVLSQRKKSCAFCHANHYPLYCQSVSNITERREILKRNNRCYNCLAPGHRVSDCRNDGRCRNCQAKHHTAICSITQNNSSQNQRNPSNGNYNAEQRNQITSNQGLSTTKTWEPVGAVLLEMAQCEVKKPGSVKKVPVNIFFDKGSQLSYCTTQLKEQLELTTIHKDVMETNTFGNPEPKITTSEVVSLQLIKGRYSKDISVHVSDYICNPLPSFRMTRRQLNELQGIELANKQCSYESSHEISILIGSDLYWQFMENDVIKTSWGAGAVKTKLGWLLSGPMSKIPSNQTNVHFTTSKVIESLNLDSFVIDKNWINNQVTKYNPQEFMGNLETITDPSIRKYQKQDLPASKKETIKYPFQASVFSVLARGDTYNNMKQSVPEDIQYIDSWFHFKGQTAFTDKDVELRWFWETEHIGIMPEDMELSTEQQFKQNIKYDDRSRRYEVQFPCKENLLEILPDNFHICTTRLDSLLKKLNKPGNEQMLKAYNEVLSQQVKDGVIEEAPTDSSNTVIHYLPHHGVAKKDKPSSVRIVYDGSARSSKKSPSLNQCLEAGPSLVNNLAAVLMRFRMFEIAVVADITKAFLQISLNEDDRDLTRFLWREEGNPNSSMKTYRFTRVPFGLTCSPFLLHATIIHHLTQYKQRFPDIIPQLLESFYVDDMVTGADSHKEAIELANLAHTIMNDANMKLSKWSSNSTEVLEATSIANNEKVTEESIKILGMLWNREDDHFTFNTSGIIALVNKLKPTKLTVLRILQKLYDPLGMLSPYLITAKLLFQELCRLDLKWDDELPENLKNQWMNWVADLYNINQVKIPRAIKKLPRSSFELVGFSDASKSAYAAVVYIRCKTSKIATTSLIIAKSRVAPLKQLTIPRLELLGAVLLARLLHAVKEFLNKWHFEYIRYFTDSLNVLYWIKGPRKWNRYISRRLAEIYNLSSRDQWYHCEGKHNPADFPTRGMTAGQLMESELWKNGPTWLSNPSCNLKYHLDLAPTPDCLEEEIKAVHLNITSNDAGLSNIIDLKDHSSYKRLITITSYVYMFVERNIKKKDVSLLEAKKMAEIQWIRDQQRQYYGDVLSHLKGQTRKSLSSIKKQLDLFIDEKDVIRCAGRFKYAALPYNVKYPVLLPKKSHLTTLIIQDRHKQAKHAGIKSTLAEVRADYWLPSGRRMVESIVRSCVVCRRFSAKPYNTPGPPPLPQTRLSEMPPFTNTGIDFAGPLFCKERGSNEAYKSCIALYTCASTRAIHLELVPNMTSVSFMNSLIRFISTRGIPHVIISDNAKTFKKSAEDLNCFITRSPTQEYAENKKITWLFYLEKSPWWGGFIERMVQSVKSVLRKTLYRTFMSYDEMCTLLKEIEAIVNSRPITHISNEVDEALTPSHLLIGKRLTQLPDDIPYVNDTERINEYRQRIFKQFVTRWRDEYLSELQSHHISQQKSMGVENEPRKGEVVIVKENCPRSTWKLAKVEEIHRGRDGKVRSIEILKANGNKARRPPQLLIPLEGKSYV